MKRKAHRNQGSIQRLREGAYRVRVSAGRDPIRATRRQISVTVHGTETDAERMAMKLLREVQAERTPSTLLTLDELFALWDQATSGQGRRKSSTVYNDRRRYSRHVGPYLGSAQARSITAGEITRLYDTLRLTLSASSVRKVHQLLHALYGWAVRREYLADNPVHRAERPQSQLPPPRAPSIETVRSILECVSREDEELWLILRLAAACGLRRGELVALRYEHLDLDRGAITVCAAATRTPGQGFAIASTKTGDVGSGTLALDRELVEVLKSRRVHAVELAQQSRVAVEQTYVFPSAGDVLQPLHPDTFTTRMRRFRDAHSEFPPVRLKDLRTFVATELESRGVDITTAKAVLRHRSEITTMRYYLASREETVRSATRALGERLVVPRRVETALPSVPD